MIELVEEKVLDVKGCLYFVRIREVFRELGVCLGLSRYVTGFRIF